MGKRTGVEPDGTQTLVVRICHALDLTPRELAKSVGISYAELKPLLGLRQQELDMLGGDTWWLISEFIDKQLAMLMAARLDLSRALQKDRTQRVLRSATVRERSPRSSPR